MEDGRRRGAVGRFFSWLPGNRTTGQRERVTIMMQRTLVLLKPDCFQRRMIGRITARFEDRGLNLLAMKLMRATPELARRHYAEHLEKEWYPELERFLTSGPLVAMVLEGPDVIRVVRTMIGMRSGLESAPGTIRGDLSASGHKNLVHASDSPGSADREISIFFREDEIFPEYSHLEIWLRDDDER